MDFHQMICVSCIILIKSCEMWESPGRKQGLENCGKFTFNKILKHWYEYSLSKYLSKCWEEIHRTIVSTIFLSPSYIQVKYYLSSNHLKTCHHLKLPQISFSREISMILWIFVSFLLKYYLIHVFPWKLMSSNTQTYEKQKNKLNRLDFSLKFDITLPL